MWLIFFLSFPATFKLISSHSTLQEIQDLDLLFPSSTVTQNYLQHWVKGYNNQWIGETKRCLKDRLMKTAD